jgi:hypothetical protein
MNRLRHTFTLLCALPLAAGAALTIDKTQCEYQDDPVGLCTGTPRFTWTLAETDAAVRGQRQTAFELSVAESPEKLGAKGASVWSCKKDSGADSSALLYAGPALVPGKPYYWKVRAWDKDGKPTGWSRPAKFVIALQSRDEWKDAQWLTERATGNNDWQDFRLSTRVTLKGDAFGIYFRASDVNNGYMWQFNKVIVKDHFLLRPHLCKNGAWSMLEPVDITQKFPALADPSKPHTVEIETSGKAIRTFLDGTLIDERQSDAFSSGTVGFRTTGGEAVDIDELTVKSAAGAALAAEDFNDNAKCAFYGLKPGNGALHLSDRSCLLGASLTKDCPRFRKTFTLADKPVSHAFASVCGLGFYEMHLNGRKVNDHICAPLNTSYSARLYFDTIDIGASLKPGANTVGLWLAPGYSDDYSQYGWKWIAPKCAIARLSIQYKDGTATDIVTDSSWQFTTNSPLTYASLYHGERYDASLEDHAWATPAGSQDGWSPAPVMKTPAGNLLPSPAPAVRVVERSRPVRITEPKPGVFVADMGQNRAGFTAIRAKGPKGTTIKLRHSELIGPDGMIDPWTNRNALDYDTFTLAGTGDWESYEPRFTYHGFRYVEITGYPGTPAPEDITGCAVHADLQATATFRSDNDGLNRLFNAARWSMLSNLQGIPTDCCMRDERTPCQMDSQAYEDAAIACFNMRGFYAKWLADITGGRGNPDWNGDAVTLPWRLYQDTGDTRFLARQYNDMAANVDAVTARFPDGVCTEGFGDWCTPNDGSWAGYHGHVTMVNTSLYGFMADILRDSARLLGKDADSAKYDALGRKIRAAMGAKLFHPATATYDDGGQTAEILPLAFGLVPADKRADVFKSLCARIATDKSRVDTGIYGTRYLADVLCDFSQPDLALHMLTQPEYPGFGFMFANGATTLWEQWTFKGGMNSHNHAMFSGAASSLLTRFGGIRSEAPGYKVIGIHPSFPAAVNEVSTARQTAAGLIGCDWKRHGKDILVDILVPPNATATFSLPAAESAIRESGKPASSAAGVKCTGTTESLSRFTLAPGIYHFSF